LIIKLNLVLQNYLSLPNNNKIMPKIKISKPSALVAKKDNTRVARKRVNELVGDKPTYEYLKEGVSGKPTKKDSILYQKGFTQQIAEDKRRGKSKEPSRLYNYGAYQSGPGQMGKEEAYFRRFRTEMYSNPELKPGAMVRDSKIPLAPTQFPE
jgi:hypothetical protein